MGAIVVSVASTPVSDVPAFAAMQAKHIGRSKINAVMRAAVCGAVAPSSSSLSRPAASPPFRLVEIGAAEVHREDSAVLELQLMLDLRGENDAAAAGARMVLAVADRQLDVT